jgi:hypothetical protein
MINIVFVIMELVKNEDHRPFPASLEGRCLFMFPFSCGFGFCFTDLC